MAMTFYIIVRVGIVLATVDFIIIVIIIIIKQRRLKWR